MIKIKEEPVYSEVEELVDSIFDKGGKLRTDLGLEYRPEQESMAKAIAEAFATDSSLLFEAGTGVGKSIAYLIPGIIKSIEQKRPFIVSTHTKALQDQLLNNDLEICRKLFNKMPGGEDYRDFKTTVLMGRSNYLCTTRLANALSDQQELFTNEKHQELDRIAEWSALTDKGTIEELGTLPSSDVWELVNADSTICNLKNCNPNDCFYQKVKAELQKAQVIILNHSLLFSLLSTGISPRNDVPGILFPEDFVVLDEAHMVPYIATDLFGMHISSYGMERTLKALYNPRTKKGLFVKYGKGPDILRVGEALDASEAFFNAIRTTYLSKKDKVRIYEPNWVEPIICEPLRKLADAIKSIEHTQSSEYARESLREQRDRIMGYYTKISLCLSLEPEDHVHWLEKGGRMGQIVAIRSAPINVAPHLRDILFNRNTSCILTSATLSNGEDFETFEERVGAEGVPGFIETSPFDFKRKCQILIAEDVPPPVKEGGKMNVSFLSNRIRECVLNVKGGSLVLFTNYADMYAVAKDLTEPFEKAKRVLLVQGKGLSRQRLIEEFKQKGNGILFGTDSFWTGIDIPGPALSQVIITRLPFENPTDPIKEAKGEWLQSRGESPFRGLLLPDAITKFRQGVGRLIRKKTDYGYICILDSRILHKEYGKKFIKALPKNAFLRFNQESIDSVYSHFNEKALL